MSGEGPGEVLIPTDVLQRRVTELGAEISADYAGRELLVIGVLKGAFVFIASLIVWLILKAIMGIRVGEEEEINGLDMSELGMEAYPDFSKG